MISRWAGLLLSWQCQPTADRVDFIIPLPYDLSVKIDVFPNNYFDLAERVGFEQTCAVNHKLISSQPRYDRLATAPYCSAIIAGVRRKIKGKFYCASFIAQGLHSFIAQGLQRFARRVCKALPIRVYSACRVHNPAGSAPPGCR